MNKKTRVTIIGLCLVLVSMAFVSPATANEGTEITVYVVTEGDVNAFFNATADGNVSYWIEDIEVKSEFISIWDYINSLKGDVSGLSDDVAEANNIATSAFGFAGNNLMLINGNSKDIDNIFDNLSKIYSEIERIDVDLDFLWEKILENNEIIGNLTVWALNLEADYLAYKNDTDNKIVGLNSDLAKTQGELSEFKSTFYNLGFAGIIIGLVVISLYLINRKYPIKHIIVDGKNIIINGRYKKITDHVKRSNEAKTSSKKARRIRRNPDKNPVKLMLIHFNIIK